MIKAALGIKKKNEVLRPLSEKEIQQKLYGSYSHSSTSLKEEEVEIPIGAPRREAPKALKPKVKLPRELPKISAPRIILPKVSWRFPWRKIFSGLWVVLKALFDFFLVGVRRLSGGWGMGIAAIVMLFFGIHALNVYRVNAMKHFKPRLHLAESSQKAAPRLVRPPVVTQQRLTSTSREKMPVFQIPVAEMPLKPATPPENSATLAPTIQPATALPEVAVNKPYAIQIATYARAEDASNLESRLKADGLPAFMAPVRRPHGKSFYLVYLGRFESFQEAQAKLKEFRGRDVAKEFPDSFVRTIT